MALVIDTEPTQILRDCTVVFRVSGYITLPTTANTSATLDGVALTLKNVHDLSGSSDLVFVVPKPFAKQCTNTGYVCNIVVDAENVNSSSIPFRPRPGWDFIDLVSPTTTSSLLTGYTDQTAVTGDQLEYTKGDFPQGLLLSVNADSTYSLGGTSNIDSQINRRVIKAAGTVGAIEKLTTLPTMDYIINNVNSQVEGGQIVTGSCTRLHSDCNITIDGTDRYNFTNVNNSWAVPTDPFKIDNYIAVASNQVSGTAGSYMYDHRFWRLNNGDIMMVYRRGSSHVDNDGYLECIKSSDNGATWGSAVTVANDATYDTRNAAGGVVSATGRVIVFFRTYSSVGTQFDLSYVYSDDNGATWSSPTQIRSLVTPYENGNNSLPWGPMVEVGGTLHQLIYSLDGACKISSTDNGVTWGNVTPIFSGTRTSATQYFAEPTWMQLDGTKFVMYVRNQNDYDTLAVCVTEDFETWTAPEHGVTTYIATQSTLSPATPGGHLVGDNLFMGFGMRKPVSEIVSIVASKWTAYYSGEEIIDEDYPARRIVYKSTTNDTGANIDFGMPDFLPITNVDYTALMCWYDNPDSSPNTDMADIWVGTATRVN